MSGKSNCHKFRICFCETKKAKLSDFTTFHSKEQLACVRVCVCVCVCVCVIVLLTDFTFQFNTRILVFLYTGEKIV